MTDVEPKRGRGRPAMGSGPAEMLSVRVDPDLHDDLVRKALACGVTVSDMARWGIRAVVIGIADETAELTTELRVIQGRMDRIAEAHHKDVDEHGGTLGDCNECAWQHPCPTYIWATTDRDPVLSTWDPSDDVDDETEENA